ncbi:amidase signature enzyme [Rhizodiscina lignyota]|uniref:Amidase signature enzyme n=1 Tax=Rhizodiscina lignyota TaxID=1504668 RepID=A0A9P4INL4_9PEZI|nr:amidase signature enzyme [Rhizodiscina lignyota]
MSVVFLNKGPPTVDAETLKGVAAHSNITLRPQDEEHYRYLLDSFDATAQQVADLPAWTNPELLPEAGTLPRKYWKESKNPLNAWSHRTEIKSSSPENNKLAGKTFAVKDNVSIGGLPITGGTFPELLVGKSEYPISEIDAVVVSRILQAGGIIAGSATCEHFSMSPLSWTSANGPVHNPWRKGYTAGGSSSGPGALVGAGVIKAWRKRHGLPPIDDELGPHVDMAIGGDQGGSIRIPGAYNGIYGLKPTHGLVPYTGILSLNPMIDHTGPMCGTLEDTAAMLGVMAGYDGIDPRMTPESPKMDEVKDYSAILANFISEKKEKGEWTPEKSGVGLRVGVIKEAFEVLGLTDEVKAIVKEAVERFKSIGATVEEVSIPMHTIGPSIWYVQLKSYEILTKHNPAAVNVIFNADFLLHNREPNLQAKAMMHAIQLRKAYDDVLANYDVLVTPMNPTTGSMHPQYDQTVGEKMAPSIGGTLNSCQFNITGHPGLAFPVGWGNVENGKGKMPIAMQIVGKRFEDDTVLKAAAAWEVPGLGLDSWDGK